MLQSVKGEQIGCFFWSFFSDFSETFGFTNNISQAKITNNNILYIKRSIHFVPKTNK